jgi:hypothetical protein
MCQRVSTYEPTTMECMYCQSVLSTAAGCHNIKFALSLHRQAGGAQQMPMQMQMQMQAPTMAMLPQGSRVPMELVCRIDNKLMKDAVLVPCCGKSFCRECTYFYHAFIFLSFLFSLYMSQKMWSDSIIYVSIHDLLVRGIFSRSSRIKYTTRIAERFG